MARVLGVAKKLCARADLCHADINCENFNCIRSLAVVQKLPPCQRANL